MVKQKTNKMLAVMLVLTVMLSTLFASILLLTPKTSEVAAAEPESSATLLGGGESTNWINKLASPVTELNIVNLTITTTASKIVGYETGTDVSEAQDGSLYYYYKANEEDSTLYNVVIYADVETIYAPANSRYLFSLNERIDGSTYVSNLKTITFDNFNTSNVTSMQAMFFACTSLTSLDVSNFNTSNVDDMAVIFQRCSSLTSLDVSSFDMSNVRITGGMFAHSQSLTQLNLPKTMGNTVITGLPFTLYVDGAGEAVTQIDSSIEGKILTQFGVIPVYPTPEAPNTPAGIDLIDVLIMGTLTLTLIVVCVAVLTVNKKRKLTNRNVTIENAKKIINKK